MFTVADKCGDVLDVKVSECVPRRWRVGADGTVQLTARYGSRVLELANGLDTVELASTGELVGVLEQLRHRHNRVGWLIW